MAKPLEVARGKSGEELDELNRPHGASPSASAADELGPSAPGHAPASPSGGAVLTDAQPGERRRLDRLQAMSQVVIATGVVLTLCYFAKLVLVVLLVSILLAFVLAPLVDLLLRFHLPRPVGALVAVLLFLAALYGVTYFSYNQASSFLQEWPRYSGEIRQVISHVKQKAQKIQETTGSVLPSGGEEKNSVRVQKGGGLSEFITERIGPVTDIALMLTFIPFLVYFMLSWQEHVRSASVMLFRMENRNTAYVTLGLISSMIRSFIVGNVLVGLFIGTASMVVFGFMHLPFFYFIGYISGFLSLVPYLGVLLAIIPPVLAGVGHIHSAEFLVIGLVVLGLHVFALNVLYPKFLGSRLQLNPLAVTLALLFWGWLWGAMGLILAIPLTAAVKIIFDHVESLRAYGAWLGE